jgi:NAD(P)-dependent dehydrogenase (short-subunit alcohol dehydrogenase family)
MAQWIVVTGAASGIGAATAARLQRDGYRVFGVDLNAAEQCDAWAVADVRNGEDVSRLGATAELRDGVLGVVNAAGISVRRDFADLDEATWIRIIDVNLNGAYRMARCFWRCMVDAGGGVIVNVASTTAFRAEPGIAAYATSKAALVGLTRCLALEGGPHGIRANAVAPGLTRTPLTLGRGWPEDEWARRAALVPLGRVAGPEDVAGVVAFLVGDDSRYVSGDVVVVAGGVGVR